LLGFGLFRFDLIWYDFCEDCVLINFFDRAFAFVNFEIDVKSGSHCD
jgi:hypothetical protein